MLCLLGVLVTSSLLTELATAHREHKVHNIVLYPDKHSWCKTTPIKQVVTFPGCQSVEIDNNVCVGACFSYSIPHTEPSDPGEVIVPYCDSCQPSETMWHNVTLDCNTIGEAPNTLLKRVQIITNCSCSPCESAKNVGSSFDLGARDSLDRLGGQQDVSELLTFVHSKNETSTTGPTNLTKLVEDPEVKYVLNTKIVTLLQRIQEKNLNFDKSQLRELLRLVEGTDNKLSDSNIADFVESVYNSDHIELDLSRLKEVLSKFEHKQEASEKHRHFGLGYQAKDIQHEDIDSIESMHLGLTQGLEGSHHLMGHLKGSHIGMGLHAGHAHRHATQDDTSVRESSDGSIAIVEEKMAEIEHPVEQSPAGHHHIGETIGLEQLVRGPHGALVLAPEEGQEKLNVAPHELKPNHAGTIMSYDNHATNRAKPLGN